MTNHISVDISFRTGWILRLFWFLSFHCPIDLFVNQSLQTIVIIIIITGIPLTNRVTRVLRCPAIYQFNSEHKGMTMEPLRRLFPNIYPQLRGLRRIPGLRQKYPRSALEILTPPQRCLSIFSSIYPMNRVPFIDSFILRVGPWKISIQFQRFRGLFRLPYSSVYLFRSLIEQFNWPCRSLWCPSLPSFVALANDTLWIYPRITDGSATIDSRLLCGPRDKMEYLEFKVIVTVMVRREI